MSIYVSPNNSAHVVKEIYVGVKDVSRRIRAAYAGIGGIARPIWGSKKVAYYGTAQDLSTASSDVSAANFDNKAVFRVGDRVDYYDENLTRHTLLHINMPKTQLVSVGDYVILGGGEDGLAYAYNEEFTEYALEPFFEPKQNFAVTDLGNYALFSYGNGVPYIDVYDSRTLEHRCLSMITPERHSIAATTVGDYAFLGGGCISASNGTFTYYNYVYYGKIVEAYCKDDLSVITAIDGLDVDVAYLAAASVGNHALFAGGCQWILSSGNSRTYNAVNAYDGNTLEHITVEEADADMTRKLAATSLEDFALFGGGEKGSRGYSNSQGFTSSNDVIAYSKGSLSKTTLDPLSQARNCLAATFVNNYVLFGGGKLEEGSGSEASSITDVYKIV